MTTTKRLRMLTSALALLVLALATEVAWQQMRLSAATSQLQQLQRDLAFSVGRVASERLAGRRDEMVRTIDWLDTFYRSPDGLRRPTGLWRPDANAADGDAIAVWILDVYLPVRLGGASEDEARQVVIDHIRTTDEWRRAHPAR